MRKSKNRYITTFFVSPGDDSGAITLNVVWMERKFDAYELSRSIPIYLQQFASYSNRKCKKIAIFTYRSPHFCFPWRRPCDYHARNMLYGWKDNSMLAKRLAACTYLSSTVSELYDAEINAQVQKSLFLPHFCFPWGRPWGNHAKCCMDGKKIRCLQIVSELVAYPSIFNSFPVILTTSAKNRQKYMYVCLGGPKFFLDVPLAHPPPILVLNVVFGKQHPVPKWCKNFVAHVHVWRR